MIEKYLNAETDIREERMLAEWFAANGAEQDEEAAARLILSEYPEAGYDAAEKDYDSIRDTGWQRRSREMDGQQGQKSCCHSIEKVM